MMIIMRRRVMRMRLTMMMRRKKTRYTIIMVIFASLSFGKQTNCIGFGYRPSLVGAKTKRICSKFVNISLSVEIKSIERPIA